ncbi:ATP-dependent helicase [Patescibacteria group bacterium]
MNYLDELNPEQKSAVLHKDGPLLIVAGAGAGKTKTLTHRILHLIKEGVAPKNILAITFTNKAAKEMLDRVLRLIEEDKELDISLSYKERPFISTFHALGVRILRENSEKLKVNKNFTILDDGDTNSLIKEALKRKSLDPKQFAPRTIKSAISKEKNNLITQAQYSENAGNQYFPRIVADVWKEYEKLLKEHGGFDFDDLILETVLLLKRDEEVRTHYQYNLFQNS